MSPCFVVKTYKQNTVIIVHFLTVYQHVPRSKQDEGSLPKKSAKIVLTVPLPCTAFALLLPRKSLRSLQFEVGRIEEISDCKVDLEIFSLK